MTPEIDIEYIKRPPKFVVIDSAKFPNKGNSLLEEIIVAKERDGRSAVGVVFLNANIINERGELVAKRGTSLVVRLVDEIVHGTKSHVDLSIVPVTGGISDVIEEIYGVSIDPDQISTETVSKIEDQAKIALANLALEPYCRRLRVVNIIKDYVRNF